MPGHSEPVQRMQRHGILIDGEGVVDGGETKILLQVFSKTVIGPIFFEFIQRKGDDGFGEGNFRALFEVDRGGPDPPRRAQGRCGGVAASVILGLELEIGHCAGSCTNAKFVVRLLRAMRSHLQSVTKADSDHTGSYQAAVK